jgi:hypothetical protein
MAAHRKSDRRRDDFLNGFDSGAVKLQKAFMKNKKIYLMPKSSATLTQSGLLAVLLERQRQRGIELVQRRTRRATGLFRRGFGGAVPRHT